MRATTAASLRALLVVLLVALTAGRGAAQIQGLPFGSDQEASSADEAASDESTADEAATGDEAAAEEEPAPEEEPEPVDEVVAAAQALEGEALQAELDRLAEEVRAADKVAEKAAEAWAAAPDDVDKETASEEAAAAFGLAADRLAAVADVAAEKGLDVSDTRALLIRARGIDASTLDSGALAALFEQWLGDGRTWLVENGPGLIVRAIAFLLVVLLFWVLSRVSGRITSRAVRSSRLKMTDLLRQFFVGLAQKIVFFVGLLFAFRVVGVDLGPVLAGVGILGFVVGFALQETLGNFAAGIMILMYRPFDVGDLIEAGGTTGKVVDLTLVSTTLDTLDNQKVIIPNGKIWGDTITNVTARSNRRVDLVVGVSYGDDPEQAIDIVMGVLQEHDKVLDDPKPTVGVLSLGESSVDLRVRPWCRTSDYWDVASDVLIRSKLALEAAGLSIPFPQRDVHLFRTEETTVTASASTPPGSEGATDSSDDD